MLFGLWLCGLALSVSAADNYSLADGTTVAGDIVTFDDGGVKVRTGDDKYTDKMPWTLFSQEGLRQLAQNPKIRPLVEPFMELPPVTRTRPADDIKVQPVSRLELPARQSLLGALAGSSVGIFLLLFVYLANLYAAFELAVCRARPVPVVMGLSAVLPVIGPILFFSLPTLQPPGQGAFPGGIPGEAPAETAAGQPASGTSAAPAAAGSGGASQTAAASGSKPSGSPEPSVPDNDHFQVSISATPAAPAEPEVSQVFKRGQFTFNRRFFETKFAGFLQGARSDADKKLNFSIKIAQGEFVVQRISRIGVSDLDIEVLQGGQTVVIPVAFADIQELSLKSKTV
jgi:hypothetical protein